MSITTEDIKQPVKDDQQPGTVTPGFTSGLFVTLGVTALVSWLAGIALHQGFGVPVPFMAAWLLILAFLFFVKTTVNIAASGWYAAVLQVTPRLVAAETAGAIVAERETERLLDDLAFTDMSRKIRGE